jgi:hypothetical protein
MTVLASVQSPADASFTGMYVAAALILTLLIAGYLALGVVSWGRFVAWLDDRETHRREQRAAGRVRHG